MGEIRGPTCLVMSSNEVSNTSIGVVGYKGAQENLQIMKMFFHDCSLRSIQGQ